MLAALRVRWPHEISKEKTAINAAKAAKAAAAAEPGVSGRRGGRRGGQGGGAASSGGGDLNQPSLGEKKGAGMLLAGFDGSHFSATPPLLLRKERSPALAIFPQLTWRRRLRRPCTTPGRCSLRS